MRSGPLLVAILVLLAADEASASTEFNGLFDARSGAMGGTGAAFLDSAAAIPTNPALLDQIGKLTLTADAFFIAAQPTAPYTIRHLDAAGQPYQNYESVRSPMTSALLPFVGGAYRVLDRLVVGVAAYPTMGLGTTAKYRPAPDQFPEIEVANKASQGLLELGTAASVRVLDNLSVGLMWRVSYAVQKVSAPLAANTPVGVVLDPSRHPITADIDVSGFNFAGLQAGVFYKPLSNLRLGLTYRNKVVAEGTGTTTTKSPLSGETLLVDTRSAFTSPHTFRAGVALSVLEDKLLLAADFKYLMYAEAWKQIDTTTTQNGVTSTTATPAYWKDSVAVLLGGEFKASELFRPRVGYAVVTSATNPTYAQQLMAPPGVSHLVTGGLGIKILDGLNVDLSAGYVVLQSRVETATPYNAGVGTYASHAGEFSLSVTYHM